MEIHEVLLDQIHTYFSHSLTPESLNLSDVDIKLRSDDITNTIQLLARGYLYGKVFPPIHIQYPDGWWQAVRERWFPKWRLSKYPVKYVEHTIRFNQIYPDFRPELPKERSVIKVCYMTNKGLIDEGVAELEDSR